MTDIPLEVPPRLFHLGLSRNKKPGDPVLDRHGKGCTGAERGESEEVMIGHRAKLGSLNNVATSIEDTGIRYGRPHRISHPRLVS